MNQRSRLLGMVNRVLSTTPVCPQCFVNNATDRATAKRMLPHLKFQFCEQHGAEIEAAITSTEEPPF